jgi:hypothetical protein
MYRINRIKIQESYTMRKNIKLYENILKPVIYWITVIVLTYHIGLGVFASFINMTNSHMFYILRIACFIHLVGAAWLIHIWRSKICYLLQSPKAPIFVVISAWYATIPLFWAFDTNWLSDKYLNLSFESPIFLLLLISSVLFVWFWEEIKNSPAKSWCD